VLDPEKPREFKAVYCDGRREDTAVTHADALEYAKCAAQAFGINPERHIGEESGPDREVEFDKELAKKDIIGEPGSREKKKQKSAKISK